MGNLEGALERPPSDDVSRDKVGVDVAVQQESMTFIDNESFSKFWRTQLTQRVRRLTRGAEAADVIKSMLAIRHRNQRSSAVNRHIR